MMYSAQLTVREIGGDGYYGQEVVARTLASLQYRIEDIVYRTAKYFGAKVSAVAYSQPFTLDDFIAGDFALFTVAGPDELPETELHLRNVA